MAWRCRFLLGPFLFRSLALGAFGSFPFGPLTLGPFLLPGARSGAPPPGGGALGPDGAGRRVPVPGGVRRLVPGRDAEAEAGPLHRPDQRPLPQLGRDLGIGDRGAQGGGHLLLERGRGVAGPGGSQRLAGQRGDQLPAILGELPQLMAIQCAFRGAETGAEG